MIIGVLGYLGSIGQRHSRNLMHLGHQVLGYDPACIGGPHLSRDSVIDQSQAVIICSPTRQHFPDMVDCHGKHLLVEKPIAFDIWPEALRGFCQAKAHLGEVVAVGNNLRFHHCVQETKKLIDGGLIGKVGWASFWVDQKTTKPLYLMDGVSRNWAAHEIDLALHLLGPAKLGSVSNVKTEYFPQLDIHTDVEIEFSLQHDNDTLSTLHMDYLTDPEKRGYKLVGSKGVIEVDLVDRTLRLTTDKARSINHMQDSWDDNYLDEITEFLKAVSGYSMDSLFLATGMNGADTLEIILAVRSAAGLKDKEA